jgi:uncharacterized repeat protein (TIGR01451 family)
MNRVWGMLKWVREKVNLKGALVVLLLGTGTFTAWQGYVRFGKRAPLPEPKKVMTGVGDVAAAPDAAQISAEGAAPDASGAMQPPAAPEFAFSPNAFGPPPTSPPSTMPPGDPSAPVYGDPGAPAYGDPSGGMPAPYQPVVAGDASGYAAPFGNEGQPPVVPGPAPDDGIPPNPIRGNAVTVADDPAGDQPGAQPLAIGPPAPDAPAPYDAAPAPYAADVTSGPTSGPVTDPASFNGAPGTLPEAPGMLPAAPAPEPANYAGSFSNPPPAPAAMAAPPDEYQPSAPPPVESPAPAPSGFESRSAASYAAPAVAAPHDVPGREPVGQGVPGDHHLEGPQTPALTLEKIAPAEIQVGKLATFELRVKNVGQIAAHQVLVTDQVPKGTQLVETRPPFQRAADGSLAWQLGTVQPGDEHIIQLQVMPQTEGEIGSVAQISFSATATARSVCTRPLLTIEHTAPEKLLIGETLNLSITVTNPGTGAATGVVVEEDVPAGLAHESGNELEYEIGTLRPGESKNLVLTLRAVKAGIIKNTIVVRGDANLVAQHSVNIEVVAPQLQVGIEGPKRRFLERPATYTVSVSNPGTASARDVEVVAYLPRGMKFVETDSHGTYSPQQHAVIWTVEELPPSRVGNVKLTAVPVEVGEQKLRIEGRAELGLSTAFEQVVSVDAAAELIHSVADLSDPIEVGSDTVYEIRVTNVGTKTATNVRISALLPAELKAINGEGPTRAANDGSRVIFEPLARLNPKEEAIFRIQANALKAGDYIVRVQLSSNEYPTPVTREESTRVYSDQ